MSKNNNITIKSGGVEKFKTEWVNKEGVFKTPKNKFIVRVKVGRNRKTVGQYDTREEADLVYSNLIEKKSLKDSLWIFLRDEHNLILLDSEVFEIIHLIDKFRSENQS